MRTTLTLDDDVAAQLERVRSKTGASFKETVNTVLRQGLAKLDAPPTKRKRFETKPLRVGGFLVPSMDNIAEVIAFAEGEDYK